MAREVDRLLAQLDRGHSPSTPIKATPVPVEVRAPVAPPTIVWASAPAPPPRPASVARPDSSGYEPAALWGRVLLGVSLGVLMGEWPYAHSCGWPLLGYGAAIATLLITGAWIALVAWKQRNAPAHILALVLFYWGLVLAAEQVLPRVGYAWTDASWQCSVTPP